jgi:hypothetical protein
MPQNAAFLTGCQPNSCCNVRFEILVSLTVKQTAFLGVTACKPAEFHACGLLPAGYLLGLLLDPEEGGGMLPRNAAEVPPDYKGLHPRSSQSSGWWT